jgi:2'-5' RNA ligase
VKKIVQGKSDRAENPYLRLFFALWPAATVQDSLHALAMQQQKHCKGRVMRVETIHLTLLFLGDTSAERLRALFSAASKVQVSAFELELDCFSGWRHNGIAYSAPSYPPDELSELVDRLSANAADAGFSFDRKVFLPHVTLLRNVERVPMTRQIAPVKWDVREFSLVQSVMEASGTRYTTLGQWPLK